MQQLPTTATILGTNFGDNVDVYGFAGFSNVTYISGTGDDHVTNVTGSKHDYTYTGGQDRMLIASVVGNDNFICKRM